MKTASQQPSSESPASALLRTCDFGPAQPWPTSFDHLAPGNLTLIECACGETCCVVEGETRCELCQLVEDEWLVLEEVQS